MITSTNAWGPQKSLIFAHLSGIVVQKECMILNRRGNQIKKVVGSFFQIVGTEAFLGLSVHYVLTSSAILAFLVMNGEKSIHFRGFISD